MTCLYLDHLCVFLTDSIWLLQGCRHPQVETSNCSSLLLTMSPLLATYDSRSASGFQDNSESSSMPQQTHALLQRKSGRLSLFSVLSGQLKNLLSLEFLRRSHLLLCGWWIPEHTELLSTSCQILCLFLYNPEGIGPNDGRIRCTASPVEIVK